MVAVWIVVILFAALFIVVPLIEKFLPRVPSKELAKYSRWILPLVALMLIVQLLLMMIR